MDAHGALVVCDQCGQPAVRLLKAQTSLWSNEPQTTDRDKWPAVWTAQVASRTRPVPPGPPLLVQGRQPTSHSFFFFFWEFENQRELESSRESYLWALGRLNTFRLSACSRYLDRLFHVQLFSFRFPLPSRLVFLHGAPPKIQPQPTLCGQLPFSYGGSSAAR